jgi:hypothetical protein
MGERKRMKKRRRGREEKVIRGVKTRFSVQNL